MHTAFSLWTRQASIKQMQARITKNAKSLRPFIFLNTHQHGATACVGCLRNGGWQHDPLCAAERHSSGHINCMRACAEAAQTARHMQRKRQFGTSCTSLLRECAQQRFSLKLAHHALALFQKPAQLPNLPTRCVWIAYLKATRLNLARHAAPSAAPAHGMSIHGYHSNGKVKSTQARAYVRPASHLHCRATAPSAPLARSAAAGTAAPSPYRA